ncbi:MAG TPA: hypothetical protein VKT49_26220 [Bryobacteraceae bacterium]|nr:hypothetical protein [Bryobacteraceae bacterium]
MSWTRRTIFTMAVLFGTAAVPLFAQSLDFEVFKSRVEPIFLKKRPGHARCVVCHEANNNLFHLQPRPEGSSSWTEEQSRKNFASVSKLVVPGNPEKSKLLLHPLAHDAGGDLFHNGGDQFTSKDDPDWKTIAAWIRGS